MKPEKEKSEKEFKTYKKADPQHPFLGLDNKICKHPKHWCKYHKVWLSNKDVKKRKCYHQLDENGNYRKCPCLLTNHYKENIDLMIKQTRKPKKGSKNERYYNR